MGGTTEAVGRCVADLHPPAGVDEDHTDREAIERAAHALDLATTHIELGLSVGELGLDLVAATSSPSHPVRRAQRGSSTGAAGVTATSPVASWRSR